MHDIWVEFHDITIPPKRWPRRVFFPGISYGWEIQSGISKYYIEDMELAGHAIKMKVDVSHDPKIYQEYTNIFDNGRGMQEDYFGLRKSDCSGATVHFADNKNQYYDFSKDTDWYAFYNEVSLAAALDDV